MAGGDPLNHHRTWRPAAHTLSDFQGHPSLDLNSPFVSAIPQHNVVTYAYQQATMRSPATAANPATHASSEQVRLVSHASHAFQDDLRSLSSGSSSGYGSTSAGEIECTSSTLTTAAPSFFAVAAAAASGAGVGGDELLPSINDFHFANAFAGSNSAAVWSGALPSADYWHSTMAAVGGPSTDAFPL